MFYCNDCKEENNWPESFMKSRGKCEICGEGAICNDYPSKWLPKKDNV